MSVENKTQNTIYENYSHLPFDTMGLFTFLRTYARRHDETDPKSTIENWGETLKRVVEACNTQLNVGFTDMEKREVFSLLYNLKCSVAGRFLWQLGTKTVDKLGLPSLENCCFTVVDEPIRPFTWTMNFLMLGSGVGYRILPEDVNKIPEVKKVEITRLDTKDADFIVPDSREGWIKLLGKVLKAHFYSGKNFSYSCVLLRSKGAPIKNFGGLASGPDILCDGILKINSVLNKRAGQKLRPIDALDIMNIIGMIVISGNVRRSAQIAIGSVHDKEYLQAKRWDLGNIPNWRAFSNNSVVCNDINDVLNSEEFWKGYDGTGEPYGLINLDLAKKCGRLGETQYPDPELEGFNPCLTGETQVLTTEGLKSIFSLVGKQFTAVVNGKEFKSTEIGFWRTGRRQVYKIALSNGLTVRATHNHKFARCLGNSLYEWVELNSLTVGDRLTICDNWGYNWGEKFNYLTERFDNKVVSEMHFTDKDKIVFKFRNNYQLDFLALGILCEKNQKDEYIFENESLNKVRNLLYGDFTTEQQILKRDNFNTEIASIVSDGEEDVFDCTINQAHCFSANGLLSHNCSEQGLANKETCCLGEIYLPNIESEEQLKKCVSYIYRICKHSLTLPCLDSKETEAIVHKNMRMGIGVTGYLQSTDVQRSWLKDCYKYLREFDRAYSEKHGFPVSIKLTTIKPSGCSRKDMLISTSKGLLRLDEIGDINGKVWQDITETEAWTQKNLEKVVKFHINGLTETKKIFTKDGNELESSLNHKYLLIDSQGNTFWRETGDLKVGDRLYMKTGGHPEFATTNFKKIDLKNKDIVQPTTLNSDLSFFLGFFYKFGRYDEKGLYIDCRKRNHNNDKYDTVPTLHAMSLKHIVESFSKVFGVNFTEEKESVLLFSLCDSEIVQWFKVQELLTENLNSLPKVIRTASKNNVEHFVYGFSFFDCVLEKQEATIVNKERKTFSRELSILIRNLDFFSMTQVNKDESISVYSYRKDPMKFFAHYDYMPAEIVKIEDSECETYDIEVENAHHYRMNGVISHNTLSILGNCTPGIHPGFSRYYKRRVRIASESPLIALAKSHNYPVEYVQNFDGTLDHTTQIVTFPMRLPEHTILAENCTAIDQLEWVKKAQTEWSDNSVSVTVYYRKGELDSIKDWLKKNYNNSVKTVSFLLHSDHGFLQAPMEQISKAEYEELFKTVKPISDLSGICFNQRDDEVMNDEKECTSGACPRR